MSYTFNDFASLHNIDINKYSLGRPKSLRVGELLFTTYVNLTCSMALEFYRSKILVQKYENTYEKNKALVDTSIALSADIIWYLFNVRVPVV